MKNRMLLVCVVLGYMFYADAGVTHWLKQGWHTTKGVAHSAFNKIENIIQSSKLNRKLVKNYKQRSDALQKKLDQLMMEYEQTEDEELLKVAKKTIEALKIEQDALLAEASKELSTEEFQLLQETIDTNQAIANLQMQKSMMVAGVYNTLKAYGLQKLENSINSENPYASLEASVKQGPELSDNEKNFLTDRKQRARQALSEFFEQDLGNQEINIAFSGSGGGYRAMILTLGYLLGLEEIGLLDAILYVATLSGSTWGLASWMQTSNSLENQKEELLEKINNKKFDITRLRSGLKSGTSLLINDIFWPKLVFGQPIGSIDLYGALLARVLLADFGKDRQMQHLPDQWDNISQGQKPFPIYTSVSMHKDDRGYEYNWYEFNPIEIRNHSLELSIPSYSFGWSFDQGVATSSWPASLGYLMGIFGSAYNVNPTDLKNIFTQYLEQITPSSKFEAIQYKLVRKALKYTSEVPYIGKVRVSPAQVNNPFRNMPNVGNWLSDRTYLVFVDGGIAYNIPLRPLVKKERNINAIIVGDSWPDDTELQKAFKDLKEKFGYNYTRVDDQSTTTLQLYKDIKNSEAPRIIYVTFVKDDDLLERVASENAQLAQIIDEYKLHEFDISRCTGLLDYCSSFSFDYTVQEFLQLMYIGFINVVANKDTIQQFLKDEFIFEK